MLKEGWVKLHRSLLEWEWYDDPNTKIIFLHLLLTVSFEENCWHGILVPRGSRIASYAKLAEETKLSVKAVRTAMKHLEQSGEVARLSYSKFTVFTLKNYQKYQDGAGITASSWQAEGKEGASKGQQYNKVKERKERKESKKCVYPEDTAHTTAEHFVPTMEEVRQELAASELHWDERELQRFMEYNKERGWKTSLPYAVQCWERNRRHYPEKAETPSGTEGMTEQEIAEMNAYLSLVNTFGKTLGV